MILDSDEKDKKQYVEELNREAKYRAGLYKWLLYEREYERKKNQETENSKDEPTT